MADIPIELKIKFFAEGKVRDLADYLGIVYQYLVGIAGVVAVALIMWGGLKWIFAGGDSGKITEAKKTISNAVIGLILALGSFLLLNTINPALVNLRLPKIAKINPRDLAGLSLCPNKDESAGKYTCNQTYGGNEKVPGVDGLCVGVSCPAGGGGCYQRMEGDFRLECVNPVDCKSRCEDIGTKELCASSACWNKFRTTCYWDGACKTGKKAGDSCEQDLECASKICNKGYLLSGGNQCAPIGGSKAGAPCDRDLDCGCRLENPPQFSPQVGSELCPRICNLAFKIDKCIEAKSLESDQECNYDYQCRSESCSGAVERVVSGAAGGAVAGGAIGFGAACLSSAAVGAAAGAVAGGVGALPVAVLGCLGGGLAGILPGVKAGAVAGGAIGFVSDGKCH